MIEKNHLRFGVIGAGRIPVVMGMAAKQSYLEHRPVRVSEIMASIPQPD